MDGPSVAVLIKGGETSPFLQGLQVRSPDVQNSVQSKSGKAYCYKLFRFLEHMGFEPTASTMRMLRAPNCANAPYYKKMEAMGLEPMTSRV